MGCASKAEVKRDDFGRIKQIKVRGNMAGEANLKEVDGREETWKFDNKTEPLKDIISINMLKES